MTYLFAADSGAHVSECGMYRWLLWRSWGLGKRLLFIMLNPSTADGAEDDPTIRKCIGFARRLGFDGIEVVNLYAFRATKPKDLMDVLPVLGEDGDADGMILDAARRADTIICAWGAQARKIPWRAQAVLTQLRENGHAKKLHALRLLADGTPEHPLMLPYSCGLVPLEVLA